MKGYVAVTDNDWFAFLAGQQEIDEVNFWQPGGRTQFRTLQPGEPFLFKLHSPENYIVGGGFFAHSTILPISLAWQAFGEKNGVHSLLEMRKRTEKYRKSKPAPFEDYNIGCIILTQPFFFPRDDWVPVPPDFSLNIVQGKTYDLTKGHGLQIWNNIQDRLLESPLEINVPPGVHEGPQRKWGSPVMILPRLGQGGFRIMVTDAYERRCAITQEKILPALEAAHIKPYAESGPHAVENGLLLRSDIHRLFDSGYVTVSTDQRFEVSHKIKEDFDNGEHYRIFHGNRIHLPSNPQFHPSTEFLTWHNEKVFRG